MSGGVSVPPEMILIFIKKYREKIICCYYDSYSCEALVYLCVLVLISELRVIMQWNPHNPLLEIPRNVSAL